MKYQRWILTFTAAFVLLCLNIQKHFYQASVSTEQWLLLTSIWDFFRAKSEQIPKKIKATGELSISVQLLYLWIHILFYVNDEFHIRIDIKADGFADRKLKKSSSSAQSSHSLWFGIECIFLCVAVAINIKNILFVCGLFPILFNVCLISKYARRIELNETQTH